MTRIKPFAERRAEHRLIALEAKLDAARRAKQFGNMFISGDDNGPIPLDPDLVIVETEAALAVELAAQRAAGFLPAIDVVAQAG